MKPAILLALFILLLACSAGPVDPSRYTVPGADKPLTITLRDLELEFAEAQRAKLEFYSPRFFKNARHAYDRIQLLRKKQGQPRELQKYLDLISHNLNHAYENKNLVRHELGTILGQWEQLEERAAFQRFPQDYEQAERLLQQLINSLERKQINAISWEEHQRQTWNAQKRKLQSLIKKMMANMDASI